MFSVERQLLAQEQVLRDQRDARSERRFQERDEVRSEGDNKGRDCGSGLHGSEILHDQPENRGVRTTFRAGGAGGRVHFASGLRVFA